MPNIIIVGFEPLEALVIRDKVDEVLKNWGKADDSISTILPTKTKWCSNGSRAPYLVVRHTSLKQARLVASALHLELNLDIEVEKIDGFLTSITAPPEGE